MTQADNTRPVVWREIVSEEFRPALVLVCTGVWLHAADALVVATMMPSIVRELGGIHLIHWSIALYEIGSIVVAAGGALLAMRFGIHIPMAIAAATFALGCLISAAAPQMWILLLGRLIQGLGGGGLFALSFVAVNRLFPRRLMARVLAGVSTLWATSALLGPIIGGLFVEFATWRWGFGLFALQALCLSLWMHRGSLSTTDTRLQETTETFPIVRLTWLCAGIVLIAFAGQSISFVRTAVLAVLGMLCLICFLRLDRAREGSRLLPHRALSLFDPVGASLIIVLCFAAATIALSLYGPLLITQLHGVSALTVGLILAAEAVTWNIVAIAVSGRPERNDRALVCTGMLMVTLSILLFVYCIAAGPLWLIAAGAMLQGAGFGMSWTFILRRATYLAAESENARVAGAIPTLQHVGYALGGAYLAIFANRAGIGYFDTVTQASTDQMSVAAYWIFWSCLPLAAIGLAGVYCFVRK